MEDAHDASLDLQTVPARPDVAQGADVVVVGEDIVLADGEAEWAQLREQLEQPIATFPVAGQRVFSGEMTTSSAISEAIVSKSRSRKASTVRR